MKAFLGFGKALHLKTTNESNKPSLGWTTATGLRTEPGQQLACPAASQRKLPLEPKPCHALPPSLPRLPKRGSDSGSLLKRDLENLKWL